MPYQDTILVVDDEPKILAMVSSYLQSSGYRVLTAATGNQALHLLAAEPVALMILDLMLPDVSGEEVCRITRQRSNLPIIMMTAKVAEENVLYGFGLGADDYVIKPFSPRQLVARVAAALRRAGDDGMKGRVLTWGELTLDMACRQLTKGGQAVPLTPHEYKILALLMARPQRVFTREEIIAHVMSDAFDGFDRTIDSHIKNLRQKIEDKPKSPQYVRTVYGMGYRFGGEVRP